MCYMDHEGREVTAMLRGEGVLINIASVTIIYYIRLGRRSGATYYAHTARVSAVSPSMMCMTRRL